MIQIIHKILKYNNQKKIFAYYVLSTIQTIFVFFVKIWNSAVYRQRSEFQGLVNFVETGIQLNTQEFRASQRDVAALTARIILWSTCLVNWILAAQSQKDKTHTRASRILKLERRTEPLWYSVFLPANVARSCFFFQFPGWKRNAAKLCHAVRQTTFLDWNRSRRDWDKPSVFSLFFKM